jgi:hypothetical protein
MDARRRLATLAMAAILPLGGATLASVMVASTTMSVYAGTGGNPHKGHPTPHDCWDEQTGNSCLGGNPQTTGCSSSAYTVYHTLYGIYHFSDLFGWVELRYSTGCGANWSRVTVNTNSIGPAEFVGTEIDNSLGQSEGNCYADGYGGYSCMAGGANESDQAKGSIETPNGSGVGQTPWG